MTQIFWKNPREDLKIPNNPKIIDLVQHSANGISPVEFPQQLKNPRAAGLIHQEKAPKSCMEIIGNSVFFYRRPSSRTPSAYGYKKLSRHPDACGAPQSFSTGVLPEGEPWLGHLPLRLINKRKIGRKGGEIGKSICKPPLSRFGSFKEEGKCPENCSL